MNKKDLMDAIAHLDDNDAVVIEVHDMVANEDLYSFYVDVIDGIKLEDGSIIKEIRLSIIPNSIR